jgi:hypothetical protein
MHICKHTKPSEITTIPTVVSHNYEKFVASLGTFSFFMGWQKRYSSKLLILGVVLMFKNAVTLVIIFKILGSGVNIVTP